MLVRESRPVPRGRAGDAGPREPARATWPGGRRLQFVRPTPAGGSDTRWTRLSSSTARAFPARRRAPSWLATQAVRGLLSALPRWWSEPFGTDSW